MLSRPSAQFGFAEHVHGRRRSLISLTPLIDVVFILLIFFMLASSFADWRAIDLPAASRGGDGDPITGAVLVDLRSDRIRLSGVTVTLDQLQARAERHIARQADRSFIVRPAPGVTLQQTVNVMDRLSAAGVTSISLSGGGGS